MANNKPFHLLIVIQLIQLILNILTFQTSSSAAVAAAAAGTVDASTSSSFSFSFETFNNVTDDERQLLLLRGAHITNSSLTLLLPFALALLPEPILFLPRSHPAFSTYFSFSLSLSPSSINAATDFTFFLTLSTLRMDRFLNALDGPPPSVISVSFIASTSHHHTLPQLNNNTQLTNRLEIRVGGFIVPLQIKTHRKDLTFRNGDKLHSWIDYDATLNRLDLRLGTSRAARPESPTMSYPMDLSNALWREKMVVGFTFTDLNTTQQLPINSLHNCTLYRWSFTARYGAPYLMHSEPLDPSRFSARPANKNPSARVMRQISRPWAVVLALIFAAACGAMVTFFALFLWFSVCAHRPVAPVEYPVHPAEVIYEKIVLVGLTNVPNSSSISK
ncbi:Lectin protein kinase family protein [Rhynchospora pubera]|uniref:Lectin protein kinase family protein n=1 Tax=Rhynchospora pubera TaxID=906938 RepID=A0AAV8E0E0_9POAL|nr:Lectin protein kinase family protein [Rhynchospora pubera]